MHSELDGHAKPVNTGIWLPWYWGVMFAACDHVKDVEAGVGGAVVGVLVAEPAVVVVLVAAAACDGLEVEGVVAALRLPGVLAPLDAADPTEVDVDGFFVAEPA
jgi:hypothetical protein